MRTIMHKETSHISDTLRSFGIRPLSHRISIYRYLLEHKTHPTADMIYHDLVKTLPSLSKTTVYNVLNLLSDHGVIHRVNIEHNEARFDADITNHIHFKCKRCNKVYDLHDIGFPHVELPENFSMETIQINIEGVCPDCQGK